MNSTWGVAYIFGDEVRGFQMTGDFYNSADVERALHPSVASKEHIIAFIGMVA